MEFSQFNVNALMEITSRPDLVFVRGQGSWLEDHAGKRYLDFVQGWAVNTLGHCAPEMRRALLEQSDKLMNPSPAFYNQPSIDLSLRLRSEEHTSELQSLMRISYAVFCLKKTT